MFMFLWRFSVPIFRVSRFSAAFIHFWAFRVVPRDIPSCMSVGVYGLASMSISVLLFCRFMSLFRDAWYDISIDF